MFDRTATDSRTVSSGSVRVVYRIASEREAGPGHCIRAGFAVPKKTGNAVQRNRIRRIMREVWRQHPRVTNPELIQELVQRNEVVTAMVLFRSTRDDLSRIPHDLTDAIARLELPGTT